MSKQHLCRNFATMVAQQVHHYLFILILEGIIGQNPASLARISVELPTEAHDPKSVLKIFMVSKPVFGQQETKLIKLQSEFTLEWLRNPSLNRQMLADSTAYQLVSTLKNKLDVLANARLIEITQHEGIPAHAVPIVID